MKAFTCTLKICPREGIWKNHCDTCGIYQDAVFPDEEDTDEEYMDDDGYGWYEVEVSEICRKIVRVMAMDEKSAREYVEDSINRIDMSTDIDKYEKIVTAVEECEPCETEFTVPKEYYF